MSYIREMENRRRKAREWKSRHPYKTASSPYDYPKTEWPTEIEVVRHDRVMLCALPRKRSELIRYIFRNWPSRNWIQDVTGARKGDPWERAIPQRPIRRPMTEREMLSCAALETVIGEVTRALENDPRLITVTYVCSDVFEKPHGCEYIPSDLLVDQSAKCHDLVHARVRRSDGSVPPPVPAEWAQTPLSLVLG